MVCSANFGIYTQCPQIYIYILSVVTSILLSLKLNNTSKAITSFVSGIIFTIILVGINYCDWSFQWITWIITIFSIFAIIGNTTLLLADDETLNYYIRQRQKFLENREYLSNVI